MLDSDILYISLINHYCSSMWGKFKKCRRWIIVFHGFSYSDGKHGKVKDRVTGFLRQCHRALGRNCCFQSQFEILIGIIENPEYHNLLFIMSPLLWIYWNCLVKFSVKISSSHPSFTYLQHYCAKLIWWLNQFVKALGQNSEESVDFHWYCILKGF